MSKPVRVRFAPSPTGPLHMGGVRTALYNYLFAKKNNGTFVIRIEDTDQTRFVPGAQEYILDALNWCGIMPAEGPGIGGDYGPYIQSERKETYRPYAELLIEHDKAYYAFDSADDLTAMRDQAKQMGMPNWQYNGVTRLSMKNSLTLSSDDVKNRIENGDPYTIRMKMPRNIDVRFNDEIRGWVVVNTNNLDDKVLFKSDGMPTYHLANVVDDHCMEISHVIRGEEWLPSAPLHVLLYEAFGWDCPKFAHLPLLLKPDGNGKLSKRDGDRLGFPVFPTNWKTSDGDVFPGYREQGYYSGAFINMLAFLGWNPGTEQELFSLGELVQSFNINQVNKSGARFDPEKIKWYNHHYIQKTKNAELAEKLIAEKSELSAVDRGYIELVVGLVKERAELVPELWALGKYFFEAPNGYDEKSLKKALKDDAKDLLRELIFVLEKANDESAITLKASVSEWIKSKGVGFGKVMMPLRVALVGSLQGVDVFDIVFCVGKEETIRRINALIQYH